MKNLILIFFLNFLFANVLIVAQCNPKPVNWYRTINKPVYRWYWDGNLNGANFVDGDGNSIDNTEAKSIVIDAIQSGIDIWLSAINYRGTIIDDMSRAENLKILFNIKAT